MKKIVLLAFVLVLLSTAIVVRFVRPAVAEETVYIKADGSVEGTDKIQRDGDVYTFTDNITDSIVVRRDNIVIDGAGYTLQGRGRGIDLSGRSNVTIKNMKIKAFFYGIRLSSSSSNIIYGNRISNNECGISLFNSSNNIVSGNNITANNLGGIILSRSSNNIIYGSNITNNGFDGIGLPSSSNNIIYGNSITANKRGIMLESWRLSSSSNNISGNNLINNDYGIKLTGASNNKFCHNNIVGNTEQVYSYNSTNVWDDGYPSGGNYWSNYTDVDQYSGPYQNETGSDGIGDAPYVIDAENKDRYPLINPYILSDTQLIYDELYELLAKYRVLQSKYENIIASYNSLQAELNDLQLKHNFLTNELNVTRNIMYALLTTTIVFIATTAYVAIRKPKVKP